MSSSVHLAAGSESATQAGKRHLVSTSAGKLNRSSPECRARNDAFWESEDCLTAPRTASWCFRRDWPIVGPLLLLIAISALIRWTDADVHTAGLFFNREHGQWTLERAEPWRSIYRKGPILAMVLGITSGLVAVLGRWILPRAEWRQSRSVRRAALFLALLLAIGPGLVINLGLKQLWGRPRPIHCVEFGGEKPFIPIGNLAARPMNNSSFPSGHASVAFYLMAPGFIVSRRRPRLATGLFIGGALFGLAMGAIRIVQGAHFVTDVLWSGALVYFVGVVLAKLMLHNDECCEA
jgi:lipid A 4'-phosphatase